MTPAAARMLRLRRRPWLPPPRTYSVGDGRGGGGGPRTQSSMPISAATAPARSASTSRPARTTIVCLPAGGIDALAPPRWCAIKVGPRNPGIEANCDLRDEARMCANELRHARLDGIRPACGGNNGLVRIYDPLNNAWLSTFILHYLSLFSWERSHLRVQAHVAALSGLPALAAASSSFACPWRSPARPPCSARPSGCCRSAGSSSTSSSSTS